VLIHKYPLIHQLKSTHHVGDGIHQMFMKQSRWITNRGKTKQTTLPKWFFPQTKQSRCITHVDTHWWLVEYNVGKVFQKQPKAWPICALPISGKEGVFFFFSPMIDWRWPRDLDLYLLVCSAACYTKTSKYCVWSNGVGEFIHSNIS
jgi:hypothetical protein